MNSLNGFGMIAAILLTLLLPGCGLELGDIPAPKDAELQTRIVTGRYMAGEYHDAIDSTRDQPFVVYHWKYTQGVSLWALLLLDEKLDNPLYTQQVRVSLESYEANGRIKIHGGSEPIDYIGAMAHAILEYSRRTGDNRFLDDALEAARFFHEDVARTPEGLIAYHSDPERGRIWIDALFMVTPLMVKAAAILEDDSYYDDVLDQFRGFSEKLRDEDTGLYHQGFNWHGSGASSGLWGRGNGWMAMAMVECIGALPEDYPGRDELLSLYRDLMAAVVAHQGPGGMWHQLLDKHNSYEETSCTGMFIYALTLGVERGWLDDQYLDAIQRAHTGLLRMISISGNIDNICPGTTTPSSEDGYLKKGPKRNESHGVGPVMLALYGLIPSGQNAE